MDRKKITKKELIISVSFLAIFIISSILISYTPSSIEITYGLTTTTEDNVIVYYNTFEPKNNDGNMKAIIIGHGGMATKEFMKGFAVEIANAGFFVIAFDFRGHGQSSGELDFTQLDYEVTAIKDVLGERGDIDMTNLGYIGYSMGGSPGVRAVHNDTAFKCFIGMGTGIPYSDYLSDYLVPSNLTTRSLNVLSIQARFDEAITMDQLLEGMSARIGISKTSIEVNKLYGSFENGNASMIYLDDNSD
ncbi:MAG: alpha/beta hydrolase, partial [archaeon]|nr:alpha/beta hydrolase [archaeon]